MVFDQETIPVLPLVLYVSEDLIGCTAEISFEIAVIICDALLLALAEEAETVMVTMTANFAKP